MLESSILGLVTLVHRLSSVLLCLTLAAGNAAVCAGWAATPEARMACCTDEESCPMHRDDDSRNSVSGRQLSQAQADTCCASSEREQSNTSNPNPTLLASISNAVLGPVAVFAATVPALVVTDGWRTVVPLPQAAVPRHVLLSVFLV